jgi:hypothetical protein
LTNTWRPVESVGPPPSLNPPSSADAALTALDAFELGLRDAPMPARTLGGLGYVQYETSVQLKAIFGVVALGAMGLLVVGHPDTEA